MRRWLLALCLPAALALGACVDADLGDVPLLCNPGSPQCPKGYTCVRYPPSDAGRSREYCLKEGVDPRYAIGRLFEAGASGD